MLLSESELISGSDKKNIPFEGILFIMILIRARLNLIGPRHFLADYLEFSIRNFFFLWFLILKSNICKVV